MNTQNNTPASRNEEALPTADAGAWQPIATAPKNTPIRLYAQGGGFYDEDFNPSGSVEGHWTDGTWSGAFWDPVHDTWFRRDDIVPTHWQPLPAAPGAAIDAREQEPFGFICDFDWGEAHDKVNLHRHPDPEKGRVVPVYRTAPSEAISPATVAQPVAYEYQDRVQGRHSFLDPERWSEWKPLVSQYHRSVHDMAKDMSASPDKYRVRALYLAAQPCASQGCGGAVSEEIPKVLDFRCTYCGSQPGVACTGTMSGAHVQRREALRAALSTAKSGGGATPEGGGK